jgi:hypothetical protein
MSERLADIQRQVVIVRERLESWTRRLAALRARREGASAPAAPPPGPLFPAEGPGGAGLDDVELQFEALDGDQPASAATAPAPVAAGGEER